MTIRNYARALSRRWRIWSTALLLCVVAAILVTFMTPPKYEAQTELFVTTPIEGANLAQQLFQGGSFSAERVKSYASLATSPRVLQPVINQFQLPISTADFAGLVTASAPQDTVLIEISVADRDPQRAAQLADAVARQLSETISALESLPGNNVTPVRAEMANTAQVPAEASSPRLNVNLLIGLAVGLIGGICLAVIVDTLDTKIRSRSDLQQSTGTSNLGVIPRSRSTDARFLVSDTTSAHREPFKQLRLSLDYVSVDHPPTSILVTSPLSGDGKSSIAGSLAQVFAETGYATCLVDADLRKPSVAEYFGLVGDVGLTSALVGRTSLSGATQKVDRNLSIVTSGPVPPNPAELLSSDRAVALLDELASLYDRVIIDTTPLLPVSDASVLAAQVDGTILVVRSGRTTRAQAQEAADALAKVNAKVLGSVLNDANQRGAIYGYGYEYGHMGTDDQNAETERVRHIADGAPVVGDGRQRRTEHSGVGASRPLDSPSPRPRTHG